MSVLSLGIVTRLLMRYRGITHWVTKLAVHFSGSPDVKIIQAKVCVQFKAMNSR